LMNYRA